LGADPGTIKKAQAEKKETEETADVKKDGRLDKTGPTRGWETNEPDPGRNA